MIVPDANLLLYAYDSTSRFHEAAASWWQGCLTGIEPVGLCGPVVFAFFRIGTNRKVYANPLSVDKASDHVRAWLQQSTTDFLAMQEADILRAIGWLEAAGTGGNLTTDAQISAIAARHRATVHTADTDFQRFPGVRWHNPLL